MSQTDDQVLTDLQESRRQFLELVRDIRAELHRYCTRMTGSAIDGEDVVFKKHHFNSQSEVGMRRLKTSN